MRNISVRIDRRKLKSLIGLDLTSGYSCNIVDTYPGGESKVWVPGAIFLENLRKTLTDMLADPSIHSATVCSTSVSSMGVSRYFSKKMESDAFYIESVVRWRDTLLLTVDQVPLLIQAIDAAMQTPEYIKWVFQGIRSRRTEADYEARYRNKADFDRNTKLEMSRKAFAKHLKYKSKK